VIAFRSAIAVQATDRFYSTRFPPPYPRETTCSIVESISIRFTSDGRVAGVEVREPGAAWSTFVPVENVLAIHLEETEVHDGEAA
jgi:hypothetical protein